MFYYKINYWWNSSVSIREERSSIVAFVHLCRIFHFRSCKRKRKKTNYGRQVTSNHVVNLLLPIRDRVIQDEILYFLSPLANKRQEYSGWNTLFLSPLAWGHTCSFLMLHSFGYRIRIWKVFKEPSVYTFVMVSNIRFVSGFEVPTTMITLWYQPISKLILPIWTILPILILKIIGCRDFKPCHGYWN